MNYNTVYVGMDVHKESFSLCAKIQKKNNIWTIKAGYSEYSQHAMQAKGSSYRRGRDMS